MLNWQTSRVGVKQNFVERSVCLSRCQKDFNATYLSNRDCLGPNPPDMIETKDFFLSRCTIWKPLQYSSPIQNVRINKIRVLMVLVCLIYNSGDIRWQEMSGSIEVKGRGLGGHVVTLLTPPNRERKQSLRMSFSPVYETFQCLGFSGHHCEALWPL